MDTRFRTQQKRGTHPYTTPRDAHLGCNMHHKTTGNSVVLTVKMEIEDTQREDFDMSHLGEAEAILSNQIETAEPSTLQIGALDENVPESETEQTLVQDSVPELNVVITEEVQNGEEGQNEEAPENSNPEIEHSAELEKNANETSEEAPIEVDNSDRIQQMLSGTGGEEIIDAFSDDDIPLVDAQIEPNPAQNEPADSSNESESESESESDSGPDSGSDEDYKSTSGSSSRNNERDTYDELEEEDEAPSGPILSKNEVAEEIATSLPDDYTIPENAQLEYIGDITGMVEKSAIIRANVSGEFRILKDDSVLCFEDRQLLGPLYETFGRLQAPSYRVKFNSDEVFEKMKERKGAKVFYVVSDTKFFYTDTIKKIKGTDASNCHDEEVPEDEQEYSDDEQELAAKQAKNRKRKQKKQESGEAPAKKKTDAAKTGTFVSYGFAPKQEHTPVSSAQAAAPVAAHVNANAHANTHTHAHAHASAAAPSVHYHTDGSAPTQPMFPPQEQSPPVAYGAPYNPAPGPQYGPPMHHQHAPSPFPVHQQYMTQQAYTPPPQYGQYQPPYQSQYGQPYGYMQQPPPQHIPQFQHFQQMPHQQPVSGDMMRVPPAGNYSPYGHPFPPQKPQISNVPQNIPQNVPQNIPQNVPQNVPQNRPPQQFSSIHPSLPPMPPQAASGNPNVYPQSSQGSFPGNVQPQNEANVRTDALQQLQQMVSQNLSRNKEEGNN